MNLNPNRQKRFSNLNLIPGQATLDRLIRGSSLLEKTILIGAIIAAAVASLGLLWQVNAAFLESVPHRGGTLTEGLIGSAGPINPLLSTTQTDRDMVKLIYSGLMKTSPDGRLMPDLAESYTVSNDQTEYTFTLREKAVFHDGQPVRASDVAFTIELAQDSDLGSRHRARWNNIETEVLGTRVIKIKLPEPRANFLADARLGILPRHIWQTVETNQIPISQYNVRPIGAGPFQVSQVDHDHDSPDQRTSYTLQAFPDYVLGSPYIETLKVRFYPDSQSALQAIQQSEIDSLSSPSPTSLGNLSSADLNTRISTSALPRVFGVFFNQNQAEALTDQETRKALTEVIDRTELIDTVLNGYGSAVDTLLSPELEAIAFGLTDNSSTPDRPDEQPEPNSGDDPTADQRLETARSRLEAAGWEPNGDSPWLEQNGRPLQFSLTVLDTPDLKSTARYIADQWRALGANIEIILVDQKTDLYQQHIRPREYQAILHGFDFGRDFDLYPFWHSSARNDPGLNITLYANITADNLLESIRNTESKTERQALYLDLKTEINDDAPALFLYSPEFIYLTPRTLENMELGFITTPEDRFADIHNWYLQTDEVWSFLPQKAF